MSFCMNYLCITALKPLYALLVSDMKHRLNSHTNMLFSSFPRLKIKCDKLRQKSCLTAI